MAKLTDIIKAFWQAPQAYAPSTNSNQSITMPALARRTVVTISPGAGAGAYVYDPYTPVANRINGDEVLYRVRMPASVNPTVNIRNASAGGTILKTIVGTGTAFDVEWTVVFNSGAWS